MSSTPFGPALALLVALALAPAGARAEEPAAAAVPAWAKAEMATRIGRWIADPQEQSDSPDWDTYGMEYRWSPGEQSVSGKLFAVRDGKELMTFWDFRIYWHPGRRELVIEQFGLNGTVGIGTIEPHGEHGSRALQEFYDPEAGTLTRVGHEESVRDGVLTTSSFAVDEQGTWTPSRTFTWRQR